MKYHIEKNTVQETLIIPLYARKICSEHYPHLFQDASAERICDRLDYDFDSQKKKMESDVGLFYKLMLKFCDRMVNMNIVKVVF